MKSVYQFIVIVAALVLTGCAWKSNVSKKLLDIGPSTNDGEIREKLLSFTPKGSDGTNVLKFVVDNLRPKSGCISYFAYFDALKASGYAYLNVTPENPNPPATMLTPPANWPPRRIYVVLGKYYDSNFLWKLTASWKFDEHDKLVDIVIRRDNSP